MSLHRATLPDGSPAGLSGPPVRAVDLVPLVGVPFDLPCEDPWVHAEDRAHAHAYVDAAAEAWGEYPDWMDFLDLDSPANALKRASRDLYLHEWDPFFGRRVLDVGCGVGRFVTKLLDRGAEVHGLDPDLESLRRCAWHAAGRPGTLDLHWASAHHLPDLRDLDSVVACEVLCYVPDHEPVLRSLVERLRPGGALLISMEARFGWAASPDAAGGLEEALAGTGVVDLPGDRWVRTWEGDELRALLEGVGLTVERLVPTHYLPDGPLENAMPESISLEEMLAWEARCRTHPVWGPLHRIWTAVGIRR